MAEDLAATHEKAMRAVEERLDRDDYAHDRVREGRRERIRVTARAGTVLQPPRRLAVHGERHPADWGYRTEMLPEDPCLFLVLVNLRQPNFPIFLVLTNQEALEGSGTDRPRTYVDDGIACTDTDDLGSEYTDAFDKILRPCHPS